MRLTLFWILLCLLAGCTERAPRAAPPTAQSLPPTWTPAPTRTPAATRTPTPELSNADGPVVVEPSENPIYRTPLGQQPLETGESQRGQIVGGEEHLFYLRPARTGTLLLVAQPSSELDVGLTLFEGSLGGSEVESQFFGAARVDGGWDGEPEGLLISVQAGFEYTVALRTLFEGSGDYSVRLLSLEPPSPQLLWQVGGSLAAGEGANVELPLQAGQPVELFLLTPSDDFGPANIALELIEPGGKPVAVEGNDRLGNMEWLRLVPEASGNHLLRIHDSNGAATNYVALLLAAE